MILNCEKIIEVVYYRLVFINKYNI